MDCEFCKSILKTKNSLTYHIKNNKKCLEIQLNTVSKVDSALILCDFCKKIFLNHKIKLRKNIMM